jgi:hypothetical protein
MLKIENLSNEVDMTAIQGGQNNTLVAGIGGLTVNGGGGSLIGDIIVNVPTIVAVQENFNTTAITNTITQTAIGVLGGSGYAFA